MLTKKKTNINKMLKTILSSLPRTTTLTVYSTMPTVLAAMPTIRCQETSLNKHSIPYGCRVGNRDNTSINEILEAYHLLKNSINPHI